MGETKTSETRNTLIVAVVIIFVIIAPATGILDQGVALKIMAVLGALGGLIQGFIWTQKRRKKVNNVD